MKQINDPALKTVALAAAINYCRFSGGVFGPPQAGQITVANASQADYGSLSNELTGYISGAVAPDLEALLQLLFPEVESGRNFSFRKMKDEDFLTESDDSDIRAEGADFKQVEYRGETALGEVLNKGLTYTQDHDKIPRDARGVAIPGWEQRIAARLKKRLIRAEILRGLAALRTASGAGTAKVWNASANPDGDLRALVASSQQATGLQPTHVLMGDGAQQLRQDSYEAAGRANTSLANHAAYTMEQLAAYLGVENVRSVRDVYQSKKGATKTALVSSEVITYSAEQGLGLEDPSTIKRVVSPTDAGSRWATYVEMRAKFTKITVEHYSVFIVPQTAGAKRYTVTAA